MPWRRTSGLARWYCSFIFGDEILKKVVKPKRRTQAAIGMSRAGDVRVGPVLAIPDVLSALGVSPQRAFAQAGVDPGLFDDPDNRVSLDTLGNLVETCAALTNCAHFGLLVGECFELKSFGPLGYLMKNSATVGDALRSLLLHLHLHDAGGAPLLLAPDASCVILGYSIYRHGTRGVDLVLDAVVAIAWRILTELCGPAWKPVRVQFSHSRPDNVAVWRRMFGSNVSFEAEVSGIEFAASWLDRPIEGADATLHEVLAKAIRNAQAHGPMSFADQVERALPQMVLSGMASAPAVARLFGIHERTLRRRLEAEGGSLQQLMNAARFELAQQLLANTALSVSEIAVALRYDDPNVFSRAFRNWAKLSPTQWRARQ
jgi:AraC-like DNA-binding protein